MIRRSTGQEVCLWYTFKHCTGSGLRWKNRRQNPFYHMDPLSRNDRNQNTLAWMDIF